MSDLRRNRLFGSEGPKGSGLEIGPRDAPMLRRPAYDVRYVDYAPTDVLRANQFDPSVNLEAIVEVDIVWGDRPLAEALGRPVDFVVASHVIEHVPDLVGWLHELHAALKPGAALGLVVPDKRFTFDALRTESSLAEAVEAYLLGYRQPSLRQVFDVASQGLAVSSEQVWRGDFEAQALRSEVLARLRPAYQLAVDLHRRPRYQDAHCWVFTPASFLRLAEELARLDLFPFEVDEFRPTEQGEAEFSVRLLATDNREGVKRSIARAIARLADAPAPPPAPAPLFPEAHRLAQLEAELHDLKLEIGAMLASKSWRITAPLRSLARRLRR